MSARPRRTKPPFCPAQALLAAETDAAFVRIRTRLNGLEEALRAAPHWLDATDAEIEVAVTEAPPETRTAAQMFARECRQRAAEVRRLLDGGMI